MSTTVTFTLGIEDVKEAVANWLRAQPEFGDGWDPEHVSVSAEMKRREVGVHEEIYPEPLIEATKQVKEY